jgi:hypothetical protein
MSTLFDLSGRSALVTGSGTGTLLWLSLNVLTAAW